MKLRLDYSPGLVAAVILVLIVAVKVCDGGMTSSYLRNDDLAHDMTLDSDVFRVPAGYNSPQQVWILKDHCFDCVLIYLGEFRLWYCD